MTKHDLPMQLLSKFPKERLFQFMVDGKMHAKEEGYHGFESREPGCMKAFYKAFANALTCLDKPVDLEFICKIHELASTNVMGVFGALTPGSIRDCGISPFRISSERFTREGILTFLTAEREQEMGMLLGESLSDKEIIFKHNDESSISLVKENKIQPNLYFKPPFSRVC